MLGLWILILIFNIAKSNTMHISKKSFFLLKIIFASKYLIVFFMPKDHLNNLLVFIFLPLNNFLFYYIQEYEKFICDLPIDRVNKIIFYTNVDDMEDNISFV